MYLTQGFRDLFNVVPGGMVIAGAFWRRKGQLGMWQAGAGEILLHRFQLDVAQVLRLARGAAPKA
jgi:hypothetical protein